MLDFVKVLNLYSLFGKKKKEILVRGLTLIWLGSIDIVMPNLVFAKLLDMEDPLILLKHGEQCSVEFIRGLHDF